MDKIENAMIVHTSLYTYRLLAVVDKYKVFLENALSVQDGSVMSSYKVKDILNI